jgi:hypothetical protein
VTWISEPFDLDTVPKALEVPRLDGWGRLLVFSARGEGGAF